MTTVSIEGSNMDGINVLSGCFHFFQGIFILSILIVHKITRELRASCLVQKTRDC